MSFNVMVIPEDFHKDRYVLRPLVESLAARVAPRPRVRVCTDPRLRGVGDAMKWAQVAKILRRYKGMVHLFLLLVDRDGDADRRAKLDHLESEARNELRRAARVFLAEHAWQEVEVWILAGEGSSRRLELAGDQGGPGPAELAERIEATCVR